MAAYAPNDALTFAKTMVKKMPVTDATLSYQILDYVSSLLWAAAPWKWTIGTLSNLSITGGTTDYAVTPPADFLYLLSATLTDGSTTNPLAIVPTLPATIVQVGMPTQVAYMDASNLVRVSPKPTASLAQSLVMLYKKTPTKITASNYATAGALNLPDVYFPAYQAGVLWQAYLYADDQRAGTATVDQDGKVQYTQQLGLFMSLIWEMRRAEKLPLAYPGSPQVHG